MLQNITTEKKDKEKLSRNILGLGVLAKNPTEIFSLLAQTASGYVKGETLKSLSSAIERLEEKGELDSSFGTTSKGRYFVQELNSTLNGQVLDEEFLKIRIKLFVAIASNNYKISPDDLVKELWKIVATLDTISITVLATTFKLRREGLSGKFTNYVDEQEWVRVIADRSGIEFEEFIYNSIEKLKQKRLLTDRMDHGDYRLSLLGIKLGEYLQEGDRLLSISSK